MTISSVKIGHSRGELEQDEKSFDAVFAASGINAETTIAELNSLATKAGHEAVEKMRQNDATLIDLVFSAFGAISGRNSAK